MIPFRTFPAAAMLLLVASLVACSRDNGQAAANPVACAQLTALDSLEHMLIESATEVAPTDSLPAYCEVQGIIQPLEGSRIGVVYRLPADWNGKVLALGGGGWMGNVTLQAATQGLSRGYATLQTDAGHTSGTGFDASSWALNADGSANEPALEDFAHRAIHLMTLRGKDVVASHYGMPARHAYYQGCSTGGRMGMMQTQRYPEDFDGVIAGAPVYSLQTQTSAQLRTLAFAPAGARLAPAHLSLINQAVLGACDADDGAADGVLRDPRRCEFDPIVLQCKDGQSGDACLTSAQVQAVRRVYRGEQMADGVVASWPLERGSELEWARFVPATQAGDAGSNSGGMHALRGPLLGDPDFELETFTAADVATVRSSWLAGVYEAKDPDISRFVQGGGKLLLWHGINDPGPSFRNTVEYHDAAMRATAGAEEGIKLFLAPGVAHCRGGTGPDQIDWLAAMEHWVENNHAPAQLPATKADSTLKWDVCAYPALPTGQADGSYSCQ